MFSNIITVPIFVVLTDSRKLNISAYSIYIKCSIKAIRHKGGLAFIAV
jgi:hypothetical protein